jgi:hypothetical protein
MRPQMLIFEQCDNHFWVNDELLRPDNNAEFLWKVVTSDDMITVLSSVMKHIRLLAKQYRKWQLSNVNYITIVVGNHIDLLKRENDVRSSVDWQDMS